jgi:hypothetical protein
MRRAIIAVATVLAGSAAGPTFAVDMTDEIQNEEEPGSEIEIDVGGGKAQIEREDGKPLLGGGGLVIGGDDDDLIAPDDPDTPDAGDLVDDELPGEGPEDLSGPDDDDDLPD